MFLLYARNSCIAFDKKQVQYVDKCGILIVVFRLISVRNYWFKQKRLIMKGDYNNECTI